MPNVTCSGDSPRQQIPAGAETGPGRGQIQNDTADLETRSARKTPALLSDQLPAESKRHRLAPRY